jgi:hypothetical protein
VRATERRRADVHERERAREARIETRHAWSLHCRISYLNNCHSEFRRPIYFGRLVIEVPRVENDTLSSRYSVHVIQGRFLSVFYDRIIERRLTALIVNFGNEFRYYCLRKKSDPFDYNNCVTLCRDCRVNFVVRALSK